MHRSQAPTAILAFSRSALWHLGKPFSSLAPGRQQVLAAREARERRSTGGHCAAAAVAGGDAGQGRASPGEQRQAGAEGREVSRPPIPAGYTTHAWETLAHLQGEVAWCM